MNTLARRIAPLAAAALVAPLLNVGVAAAQEGEGEEVCEDLAPVLGSFTAICEDTLPQLILVPGVGIEGNPTDPAEGQVVTFHAALVPPPQGEVEFTVTTGAAGDTAFEGDDYEINENQQTVTLGGDNDPVKPFTVDVVEDPQGLDGLDGGDQPVETFTVTLQTDDLGDDHNLLSASTQGIIVDDDYGPDEVLSLVPRQVIVIPDVAEEDENLDFTAVMVPPPGEDRTFDIEPILIDNPALSYLAADENDFVSPPTMTWDADDSDPHKDEFQIDVLDEDDPGVPDDDESLVEIFTVRLVESEGSEGDLTSADTAAVIVDRDGDSLDDEVFKGDEDDDGADGNGDGIPNVVDGDEDSVTDLDEDNDDQGQIDAIENLDANNDGIPDVLWDALLKALLDSNGNGDFDDCALGVGGNTDDGCDLDADDDGDTDPKDIAIIVFEALGFAEDTLRPPDDRPPLDDLPLLDEPPLDAVRHMAADIVFNEVMKGIVVPLFDDDGDGDVDAEDLDRNKDGNSEDQIDASDLLRLVEETRDRLVAGLTPVVSVRGPDGPVDEGNSGTTDAVFTVSLSAPSLLPVKVDVATQDGTAEAGGEYSDYDPVPDPETVTFDPLVTEQTVTVPVVGDTHAEADETFDVTISNPRTEDIPEVGDPVPPSGSDLLATIDQGNDQASATIRDGDGPAPVLTVSDVTVGEPAEGEDAVAAVVTVSLDKAPTQNVTVGVETEAGTATADDNDDYEPEPVPASLTFAPGETTEDVSITVNGDGLDEPDEETFEVTLTDERNAVVSSGSSGTGTVTIIDSDAEPVVSVGDAEIAEDDEEFGALKFPVTLSKVSGRDVAVHFSTTDAGDATPGDDYETEPGTTLTIPAGDAVPGTPESEVFIEVPVVDDDIYEHPEEVVLELDSASNATLGTTQATGTILNDEDPPVLSVSGPATVTELDVNDTTDAVFTVERDFPDETGSTEVASTVDVSTEELDEAEEGSDYDPLPDDFSVTVPASDGSDNDTKTFDVTVFGDDLDEPDEETFEVKLSEDPEGDATIDTDNDTVEVTIEDDDDPPELSIGDAESREEDADPSATVDVTLGQRSERTVTVDVSTVDDSGSAEVDSDYRSHTETLTFDPGEVTKSVTVEVFDDTLDEPDEETFEVRLSNATTGTGDPPEGVGFADPLGEVTIVDDDDPPTLTIGPNVEVLEDKDGATTPVTIDVHLSHESGRDVRVNVATVEKSAEADVDYSSVDETVTFAAGVVTQPVTVNIVDDEHAEGDETFEVKLSNATTGVDDEPVVVGDNDSATVTIVNDDGPRPKLRVDNLTVNEGNGTASVQVTLIEKDGNVTQDVSVDFTTVTGDDDTAETGSDYDTRSGTKDFEQDGGRSAVITVPLEPDTLDEFDETFTVELSNASNAGIEKRTAVVTIADDDAPPTVEIEDVSVVEDAEGSTTDVVIPVTLSEESGRTVAVEFETADGEGEHGATAGESGEGDYDTASDTLTFGAGETTPDEPLTVTVNDDALDEFDEDFTVTLSFLEDGNLDEDAEGHDLSATATIEDDDVEPTVSVGGDDAITVLEGDSGTETVEVPVTLSAESGKTVRVEYTTVNRTAKAGADYGATSDTLIFGPGETGSDETPKTIPVTVKGDRLDEPDETFAVKITAGPDANATIENEKRSATVTIVDDDPFPALSVSDTTVTEGDSGTTTAEFTVSLSPASGKAVTVAAATSDGSATAGDDYASTRGRLVFEPGATSAVVPVTVRGDTEHEPDETLRLTLSSAKNATVADATGVATIVNDDDETPQVEGVTVEKAPVNSQSTPDGKGYWIATSEGDVFGFGNAERFGSLRGAVATAQVGASVVDLTATPEGDGYWLLDNQGGVHTFGEAPFFGSLPGRVQQGLVGPARVTGMARTPTGNGYVVLDEQGGVHTFGDATFHGSIPARRAAGVPVGFARATSITVTPSGHGYVVLDEQGGIHTFGDATFLGSIPGLRASGVSVGQTRFVSVATTPNGGGYWILDEDGGVHTFGNAEFHGSIPGLVVAGQTIGNARTTSIEPAPGGEGYWIFDEVGGVFTFGDARFAGSVPGLGRS